jgi:hypothetical protein
MQNQVKKRKVVVKSFYWRCQHGGTLFIWICRFWEVNTNLPSFIKYHYKFVFLIILPSDIHIQHEKFSGQFLAFNWGRSKTFKPGKSYTGWGSEITDQSSLKPCFWLNWKKKYFVSCHKSCLPWSLNQFLPVMILPRDNISLQNALNLRD